MQQASLLGSLSEVTHLPAFKCGDVWDVALVKAEGDHLEEVLESPAAIELLHAQPCMAQLDPAAFL